MEVEKRPPNIFFYHIFLYAFFCFTYVDFYPHMDLGLIEVHVEHQTTKHVDVPKSNKGLTIP
jgi:hypothetical protein